MPELAYINGKIMRITEALVPIEDRGYQFGDAVYEFIASYKGKLFALEPHLDRLENSLRGLNFPPVSRDRIREAIHELLAASGIERAGIYLQISRGVAQRNHAFPSDPLPQVVMTIRHVPTVPDTMRKSGARAITITDFRWGHCDIKTVQLLPNVLAKQQAIVQGTDDAIFVSREGIVREGTTSNIFIVEKGSLLTHPLSPQILPGITRAEVLTICQEENIPVHEVYFDVQRLLSAEEVFSTGTVTEVMPIVQIDGKTICNGRPGIMTERLFGLLRKRAGASL
jgi:D-alanine transaminase